MEETVDVEDELQLAAAKYNKLTDKQRRFVSRVLLKLDMQDGGITADNTHVRPPEGDAIMLEVKTSEPLKHALFWSSGPGGSGKSFAYDCLFHALRTYGFNVVVVVSTGAAAILLPTGTTVHQAATLPVPLTPGCQANPRGKRLLKYASAHVFICDEVSSIVYLSTFGRTFRLRCWRTMGSNLLIACCARCTDR